jgi:hypothetical protein
LGKKSILFDTGKMTQYWPSKWAIKNLVITKEIFSFNFAIKLRSLYIGSLRGVHGLMVKVVDFKPLAPHLYRFETGQGLWILTCEEAIQLAYGTSVVLLRCLFMPEIMHRRAPEVFLHQ